MSSTLYPSISHQELPVLQGQGESRGQIEVRESVLGEQLITRRSFLTASAPFTSGNSACAEEGSERRGESLSEHFLAELKAILPLLSHNDWRTRVGTARKAESLIQTLVRMQNPNVHILALLAVDDPRGKVKDELQDHLEQAKAQRRLIAYYNMLTLREPETLRVGTYPSKELENLLTEGTGYRVEFDPIIAKRLEALEQFSIQEGAHHTYPFVCGFLRKLHATVDPRTESFVLRIVPQEEHPEILLKGNGEGLHILIPDLEEGRLHYLFRPSPRRGDVVAIENYAMPIGLVETMSVDASQRLPTEGSFLLPERRTRRTFPRACPDNPTPSDIEPFDQEFQGVGKVQLVMAMNPASISLPLRQGETAWHRTSISVEDDGDLSLVLTLKPSVSRPPRSTHNYVDAGMLYTYTLVLVNGTRVPVHVKGHSPFYNTQELTTALACPKRLPSHIRFIECRAPTDLQSWSVPIPFTEDELQSTKRDATPLEPKLAPDPLPPP